jgi:hypothetical protein
MELPQFVYARPPDLSGIGDAMDNRYKFQLEQARANHLARQDDIALQNEMLKLKAGQTAIANAAASKAAIKNALADSVIPLPGEAPGPQLPSLQNAQSRLALSGRFPEANLVSNTQEQFAKQQVQEGLVDQSKIKTSSDQLALENATLKQAQAAADTVASADELLALNAAIHSDNSPLRNMFNNLGIDAATSQAKLLEVIKTQGFPAARAMFAQGAATAQAAHAKELQDQATLAGTQATTANTVATGQRAATAETAPIPKEVNLGNRVVMIDSNPRSPTFNQVLTSLQMGAAPKEATPPTPSNVSRLMDELAVVLKTDPNNAERIATLRTAISKESGDAKLAAQSSTKLEPGQFINAEGNIEDTKGSRLFIKNSKAHAADAKNVQLVNSSTDTVFKDIDNILDIKKATDFNANFGYGSSITSTSPGARDVKAKLDTIKSALKEAGLALFRSGGSIGQMTEREWPIVEQLIASLDSNQSPEAARSTMNDIKTRLDRIRNITNNTYDTQWGATQYHRPELTKSLDTFDFGPADAILGGK